ncbi:MAG TPA: hypothetical protein VF941_19775 [Clostridia bacterium]
MGDLKIYASKSYFCVQKFVKPHEKVLRVWGGAPVLSPLPFEERGRGMGDFIISKNEV